MEQQALLDDLVRRLTAALGDELASVVLYGSAAAGDFQENVSDLNVLCVLRAIGPDQLERAYPAVDWWLGKKQPAPVLLSSEEIANAHDAFAIELIDIQAAYRILLGEDWVRGVQVDREHHRYQVEHELRSCLLRLRERYLTLQRDRAELTKLMADSLPAFATLVRHALILAGASPGVTKQEIFALAASRIGVSAAPFETILMVREGRRLEDSEIRPLFASYLKELTTAAEFADRL